MRAVIEAAFAAKKVDLKPDYYPATEPFLFPDFVMQGILVTEYAVYLVPGTVTMENRIVDETLKENIYMVAPIKIDAAAITKAQNILSLIDALGAPKGMIERERISLRGEVSRTPHFSETRIAAVFKFATIIDGNIVLLEYGGALKEGTFSFAARPLIFNDLSLYYAPVNSVWSTK